MRDYSNTEKVTLHTSQAIYDAFNSFIFSSDTKVLAKLVARTCLIDATQSVPGDIVECGVFKGSGLATWIKLKRILMPNAFKKVIGFDYFDTAHLLASLSGLDKQRMTELFGERGYQHGVDGHALIDETLRGAGFEDGEYELIAGPIATTAPDFCARRPGFRISLLYCDLDLGDATYEALTALWPRVVPGGLAVFDEYAFHQWSESDGVDRFCREQGLQLAALAYPCPTAYVVKT
jgi:hypothetical protein